jgi:hypothetical protein
MASLFSQSLVLAFMVAVPSVLAGTPVTCLNPQLSCQNTTTVADLCCFNAPGGQLLQTQFWDTCKSLCRHWKVFSNANLNQLRVLVRATHGQFMGSGKPCQLEMGRRLMIWQA